MKKYAPIIVVLFLLAIASYFLLFKDTIEPKKKTTFSFEEFNKNRSCASLPKFLLESGLRTSIIDLSQQKYKGIAFYTRNYQNVLHKKSWERFDALGTYTIDKFGNLYLTPNPFISIKPSTFNLQKAIYKMDSTTGKLTRWLVIDSISPSATNPYGFISIVYDCDDDTLYASAIDKSGYKGIKGRIYHINPKDKNYTIVVKNFDALTLNILKTKNKKYLLAGSAIDSSLYAFEFKNGKLNPKPHLLFTLPNPKLHIRKVKIIAKNSLQIEAIKFSYSLIAETNKKQRYIFIATFNPTTKKWEIKEKN